MIKMKYEVMVQDGGLIAVQMTFFDGNTQLPVNDIRVQPIINILERHNITDLAGSFVKNVMLKSALSIASSVALTGNLMFRAAWIRPEYADRLASCFQELHALNYTDATVLIDEISNGQCDNDPEGISSAPRYYL